jgi:hypothetical protein
MQIYLEQPPFVCSSFGNKKAGGPSRSLPLLATSLAVLSGRLDKPAMPGVKPNITSAPMNTEQAVDLAAFEEVESIVTVGLNGLPMADPGVGQMAHGTTPGQEGFSAVPL